MDPDDAIPLARAEMMMNGKDGLFVGMLNEEELAAFEYLCSKCRASKDYSGAAGFLGLAKVRLKK